MELQSIKTEEQYQSILDWVDKQFDENILPNSPEDQKLQIALLLIKHYEDENYSVPSPDPIAVVK